MQQSLEPDSELVTAAALTQPMPLARAVRDGLTIDDFTIDENGRDGDLSC